MFKEKTKIFKDHQEFIDRKDKSQNGVNQEFADKYPHWKEINDTNTGCWNCYYCMNCIHCNYCRYCLDCWYCKSCKSCINCYNSYYHHDGWNCKGYYNLTFDLKIPIIKNIHQEVYKAASKPDALNLEKWHTCDTTHCRGGWVVFLAGEEGKELEEKTSTLFAAVQIYKASSDIHVPLNMFFESYDNSLKDIKRCVELELNKNN